MKHPTCRSGISRNRELISRIINYQAENIREFYIIAVTGEDTIKAIGTACCLYHMYAEITGLCLEAQLGRELAPCSLT